jgi:katanin p60 ATPase-containing subunit A1
VLFELARHHAPSTIFVDEIDALMSARGDSGEHEGSRRMKTELLVQMDGLLSSTEQVFLLAATNLPWELDMALLRRLEKRILVPYPTTIARRTMLQKHLPKEKLAPNADIDAIAAATEGYSGSDLVLVAKEAGMRPLRRLLSTLDLDGPPPRGARPPPLGPVDADDLHAALSATKPTVHDAERYARWADEYGSV